MKVRLLNSAMMPCEGIYEASKISFDEFKKELVRAFEAGELESYIGYPQNVALIKKWTGCEVPLNRAQTILEDGDTMLVMKLKYRVANPAKKGQEVGETDFEFYKIKYNAK